MLRLSIWEDVVELHVSRRKPMFTITLKAWSFMWLGLMELTGERKKHADQYLHIQFTFGQTHWPLSVNVCSFMRWNNRSYKKNCEFCLGRNEKRLRFFRSNKSPSKFITDEACWDLDPLTRDLGLWPNICSDAAGAVRFVTGMALPFIKKKTHWGKIICRILWTQLYNFTAKIQYW